MMGDDRENWCDPTGEENAKAIALMNERRTVGADAEARLGTIPLPPHVSQMTPGSGSSWPSAEHPSEEPEYEITYFKAGNGKYYTTDKIKWPTDAPDHSGWNPIASIHRIKTMHAVCLESPHGFPQFSPAQKSEDEGTAPSSGEAPDDGRRIEDWYEDTDFSTVVAGADLKKLHGILADVRRETIKACVSWVDDAEGHGCADELAVHMASLSSGKAGGA